MIKRLFSIVGTKIFTLILTAVITPILIRLLDSSNYGDYAFLSSVLSITMILVNAGIFDGIRKYIAETREIENWEERPW